MAAGRTGPPSAGSSSTARSNGWRMAPSGIIWGRPSGRPKRSRARRKSSSVAVAGSVPR